MLVLSRKNGQTFTIGKDITIVILQAEAGKARVGILAPKSLPIARDDMRKQSMEVPVASR